MLKSHSMLGFLDDLTHSPLFGSNEAFTRIVADLKVVAQVTPAPAVPAPAPAVPAAPAITPEAILKALSDKNLATKLPSDLHRLMVAALQELPNVWANAVYRGQAKKQNPTLTVNEVFGDKKEEDQRNMLALLAQSASKFTDPAIQSFLAPFLPALQAIAQSLAAKQNLPKMVEEAILALKSLGHSETSAKDYVDKALAKNPNPKNIEELTRGALRSSAATGDIRRYHSAIKKQATVPLSFFGDLDFSTLSQVLKEVADSTLQVVQSTPAAPPAPAPPAPAPAPPAPPVNIEAIFKGVVPAALHQIENFLNGLPQGRPMAKFISSIQRNVLDQMKNLAGEYSKFLKGVTGVAGKNFSDPKSVEEFGKHLAMLLFLVVPGEQGNTAVQEAYKDPTTSMEIKRQIVTIRSSLDANGWKGWESNFPNMARILGFASTESMKFFSDLCEALQKDIGTEITNAISSVADPEMKQLLTNLMQNIGNVDDLNAVYQQFYSAHNKGGFKNFFQKNKAPELPPKITPTGTYMAAERMGRNLEQFQWSNKDVGQAIRSLMYSISIWGKQVSGDKNFPAVFPKGQPGQKIEDFDTTGTTTPPVPLKDEWANPVVIGFASVLLNYLKQRYTSRRSHW